MASPGIALQIKYISKRNLVALTQNYPTELSE